jgi:hypothetical protein
MLSDFLGERIFLYVNYEVAFWLILGDSGPIYNLNHAGILQ